MRLVENRRILIAENGRRLALDYDGALAAHAGDSWFGVAVAFRMLQAAALALTNANSDGALWDRSNLQISSGHPGLGVRDAINYVTACVDAGHYMVEDTGQESSCGRKLRFCWTVRDRETVARLRLRDGFVPEELYALLDRRGTAAEQSRDAERFSELKRELAERMWAEPLQELIMVEVETTKQAQKRRQA